MSLQTQTYMLDHTWVDEPRRLALLEQLHDPTSFRRLAAAGVRAGDRCLEVGAGRGSVARWLGEQAGPSGSVLAVDLETGLLAGLDGANVEVLAADVLDLDLADGSFDVIHTRAVLMHIPERRRAIERLAGWLAPAGRLVVEEPVWLGPLAGDAEFAALTVAYQAATAGAMDWSCGREIVTELAAAGLTVTATDADLDTIHGATPLADWYRLSMNALRPPVLAAGLATDDQIERQIHRLADPAFRATGFAWIGACAARS